MAEEDWIVTQKRFVVFFDILGFKDLVQRNTHEKIVEKLQILKDNLKSLEITENKQLIERFQIEKYQTRSITFSDSIIIFSKKDELKDAAKLIVDSYLILQKAINIGIPIKGAFSYGEITVDFKNALFFGQPIIDAYLLHDELQLYSVISDHHFEAKVNTFTDEKFFGQITTDYKVNLKSGKVVHKVLRPQKSETIKKHIISVEGLYNSVSGRPRSYVDNTLEFLRSLLSEGTTSTHPTP